MSQENKNQEQQLVLANNNSENNQIVGFRLIANIFKEAMDKINETNKELSDRLFEMDKSNKQRDSLISELIEQRNESKKIEEDELLQLRKDMTDLKKQVNQKIQVEVQMNNDKQGNKSKKKKQKKQRNENNEEDEEFNLVKFLTIGYLTGALLFCTEDGFLDATNRFFREGENRDQMKFVRMYKNKQFVNRFESKVSFYQKNKGKLSAFPNEQDKAYYNNTYSYFNVPKLEELINIASIKDVTVYFSNDLFYVKNFYQCDFGKSNFKTIIEEQFENVFGTPVEQLKMG